MSCKTVEMSINSMGSETGSSQVVVQEVSQTAEMSLLTPANYVEGRHDHYRMCKSCEVLHRSQRASFSGIDEQYIRRQTCQFRVIRCSLLQEDHLSVEVEEELLRDENDELPRCFGIQEFWYFLDDLENLTYLQTFFSGLEEEVQQKLQFVIELVDDKVRTRTLRSASKLG